MGPNTMKRQIIAAALIAVSASACNGRRAPSPLDSEVAGEAMTPTPAQISVAQKAVRDGLKDPDSARFTGPAFGATQPNGDIDVCGTVNAKNSYGGYVGASPYIARLRAGKAIDSTTASGSEAKFLYELCHRRGVRIPS